jgi:hypothetical protein
MPNVLLYHRERYPISACDKVESVESRNGKASGGSTPGAAAPAKTAATGAGTPACGTIAGIGGAAANPRIDLRKGLIGFDPRLVHA